MTTLRAAEQLGLAARVRDVPDAPVLLFVHGLGCDASFWDEAWTSADLERYSLLAVDLPGFGAAPPVRPFTFDMVVERLARLVDALHGPVVAVGHSMGGTLVGLLAEVRPGLRGIVLVDANLLPVEAAVSAAGARALAEGRFDEWFADLHRWGEENADGNPGRSRYVPALRRADQRTYAEACRELVASTAGDFADRYAALPMPRVYIAGSETDPAHEVFLRTHGLALERIADAGHSIQVDRPEHFYAFLRSWTEAAPASSS